MGTIILAPNADCGDRKGKLIHNIERERRMLMAHPVYTGIRSFDELCIFMQHHAFAVWDFIAQGAAKGAFVRRRSVDPGWQSEHAQTHQ